MKQWFWMGVLCSSLCVCSMALTAGAAQIFDERFEDWPVQLRVNGQIVIDSVPDDDPAKAALLTRLAAGKHVVALALNPGSETPAWDQVLADSAGENGTFDRFDLPREPCTELEHRLGNADVIALRQDGTLFPAGIESLRSLRQELQACIDRGGTIMADANAAGVLGEFVLRPVDPAGQTVLEAGLNLLPNCIVQSGYRPDDQSARELLCGLARSPRSVGIGIADQTLLMLDGRRFECIGQGAATFVLMANERLPIRSQTIRPRADRSRLPEFLVDLTQWRREAIDRTLPPFPPDPGPSPVVENGSLVIVGGGGMPTGLMDQFIELAGGAENARLIYVPCSEDEQVDPRATMAESWKRRGVQHVAVVHTKDRIRANSDDEFLAPLKEATGIWFGGGRQWNLSDSYYGTRAHQLMKDVLRRGGVIGGSSAGASIQARYLARATPIENFEIMAPGYERGGLGFIGGVAIDQHFSQRHRQTDMTQLVNRYPQLLGIGLDESTAIIVQGSIATVVGEGRVYFYDRRRPVIPGQDDYLAFPAGARFDLEDRRPIDDPAVPENQKPKPKDAG